LFVAIGIQMIVRLTLYMDQAVGGDGNIIVSTIGLVIHSIADGAALGASLYCKLLIF
jgi:hypothetical protein